MRCGIPASHCGGSRQVHQIRRGRRAASTRRTLSIAIGQLALARDDGTLNQAGGKKRGRKPRAKDPSAAELICLRRDRDRLAERLRQAELIIEVQKKLSDCSMPAPVRQTTRRPNDRNPAAWKRESESPGHAMPWMPLVRPTIDG
jgi:hypothetical protein